MQSELDALKGQKGNVQATVAPENKLDEKKEEVKAPEEQKPDQVDQNCNIQIIEYCCLRTRKRR